MKSRGLDSKRSWVIAVASGIIFLLVSLPFRLGSLLFVSLIDQYGANRKNASSPFILAYLMRSVAGPFAGYFGELFGLQIVTALGCLLCAIGVGTCFLADDIIAVDILLGIIFGFGYGLATALVPEILNRNFKNHRAKANGIYYGMSGIGASIAPPLFKFILLHFGVSGTLLIMSAIILNSIPSALFLKSPKLIKKKDQIDENEIALIVNEQNYKMKEYHEDFTLQKKNNGRCLQLASPCKEGVSQPVIDESQIPSNYESISEMNYLKSKAYQVTTEENSINSNKECRSNISKNHFIESNKTKSSIIKTSSKWSCSSLSILWNPLFLIISLIQSTNIYIVYIFWTITIDLVRDKGIEHHLEVYFVTALSLLDCFGRFFLASVTDGGLIAVQNFSACSMTIMGLSCLMLTLVSSFGTTMLIICLISLISGGNTTAQPGIITKFIQEEKRSMAMANRMILTAPMSFPVPFLIGYFRGTLGSYDGLLYLMAGMCLVCSALLFFLPRFALFRCRSY